MDWIKKKFNRAKQHAKRIACWLACMARITGGHYRGKKDWEIEGGFDLARARECWRHCCERYP